MNGRRSKIKILVTGANGYIGSHVVQQLLNMGADVIASDIQSDNIDSRARIIKKNIFSSDLSTIYSDLGEPDTCLHLAWRNGFVHNADTHIGDLSGHYDFLISLMQQGIKRIAVMGTMHEVGYWEGKIDENTPCKPLSMYGIAKNALRQAMMNWTSSHDIMLQWIRGFYIVGDDEKNHSIFAKIIEAERQGKESFPFTSGKIKYDFIDVDELAEMIACVVMQDNVKGIINCCSGNPVSLGEKVEDFIRSHNFKIKLNYGAYPDRPYDSPIIYGDNSKIKQILSNRCK